MTLIECTPARARISEAQCLLNQQTARGERIKDFSWGNLQTDLYAERRLWCNEKCPRWDGTKRQDSPKKREQFLKPKETAEMLGVSIKTLYRDRMLKRGLPYIAKGTRIFYRKADVEAALAKEKPRTARG